MKYLALLLVAVLAGCSSSSTPLTNDYSIKTDSGVQRFRVACSGLLGGKDVCLRRAKAICGEQSVSLVGTPERDAMIFQCAAPQAPARK